MRWAIAYALERLLLPLIATLLFLRFFGDPSGAANPYVDQVNQWLGLDALTRALDHGF